MAAAEFEGEGCLALKEVPIPRVVRPNQVLLSADAVTICGTDMLIVEVPPGCVAEPGTILGHEFVGIVVDKGDDVAHAELGERVAVNPND